MAYSSVHDANHLVIGLDAGKFPDIEKYPIGSVWWYSNPYTKKSDYSHPHRNHDFTTSRPVIIMSRSISFSNQLIVIQRNGTMTRPGFDSYFQDKAVDDRLVGARICPYDIKSVGKEYLTEMIGFLKPELFAAVQKAFAWHVGLSDEVPPYMLDLYNRARWCNEITYGGMEEHLAKRAQDRQLAKDSREAAAEIDEVIDEALQQAEDVMTKPLTDTVPIKAKGVKYGGRTSVLTSLPESEKARIAQMRTSSLIAEFNISRSTAYRWKRECQALESNITSNDTDNSKTTPTPEIKPSADLVANAFAAKRNEDLVICDLLNGQKATPFQITQLIKRIAQSKNLINIMSDEDAKTFIQIPIANAPKMRLTKELMLQLQNEYLTKLLEARG